MNENDINNDIVCKRCGYNTDFFQNLLRHLRNKKECSPIYSNESRDKLIEEIKIRNKSDYDIYGNRIYKCKYCEKIYYHCSSKTKHQVSCNQNELFHKNKELEKKLLMLEKIIEKNEKNTNINNNNQVNSFVNNGVNNNFINNGIINNNNINGDFYITNLDNFNSNIIKENANLILNIGTYLVDNILDNKCKYLTDIIHECKIDSLTDTNYLLVKRICRMILESDNPLTKNMFMDKQDDNHAYINLNGKFYWIDLNELIEVFCNHLPEIIKQLVKYKDLLDGIEPDDKYFVSYVLENFLNLKIEDKKKEIIELLITHLIDNKKLVEEFLKKAIPIDELSKLKPDKKFLFKINDAKIAEIKFLKLGLRDDRFKPKRLRMRNIYIDESESDDDTDDNINEKLPEGIQVNTDDKFNDTKTESIIINNIKYYKRSFASVNFWYNYENCRGFLCTSSRFKPLPLSKIHKKIQNKLGDSFYKKINDSI